MHLILVLVIAMSNIAFAGKVTGTVTGTSPSAVSVESLKLKTPRGVEIDAVIHFPSTTSPVPAVIIGSGQGYHMGLPLSEELAKKIADKGYAAIRFNWHYYSQGGQPSENLSDEVEDYAAVVSFAKNHKLIDANKIMVAGKSLGSLVSYRYFHSDIDIKALVLMTPICTWHWDDKGDELPGPVSVGAENYPELLKATRPVVVALGNSDALCSVPMLYDFLKSSTGNIATVVVQGDHSLNIGAWDDPAYEKRNSVNINAATDMIAHWIRLVVDKL